MRRGRRAAGRQDRRRPDRSVDTGQNIAGYVRLVVRGGPAIGRDRAPCRGPGARWVPARQSPLQRPRPRTRTAWPTTARRRSSPPSPSTDSATPRSTRPRSSWASRPSRSAAIRRMRAAFACSDARLTRLHENVVWSQRDNFVSVPTDCPQRDERLGWTGDAQAFAPTGRTLFDSEAFWASWLRDLELEQDDVLGVPSVVPDVVLEGSPGSAGPAGRDAATIVPWAVSSRTATRHPPRASSTACGDWVDSLVARRGERRPARAVVPVRRLARPGRADRPALDRQGRLDVPRERLLRPQCPARGRRRRPPSATPTRPGTTGRSRVAVAARTWARWATRR